MREAGLRNVLVTGSGVMVNDDLPVMLEGAGYEVQQVPWSTEVLALVETQAFGVVVVRLPLPGAGFGVLLSSIRAAESSCRRAGLVILTPKDDTGAVEKLVGHGVNRVLPTTAGSEELLAAINSVQGAAHRVSVRLPVQLGFSLPTGDRQAFCQTENLSESGMLLRGFQRFPPGTKFSFQIKIPGVDLCLKGVAEVTRTTDVRREKIEGFGARFVEIDPTDRWMLDQVLVEGDHSVN